MNLFDLHTDFPTKIYSGLQYNKTDAYLDEKFGKSVQVAAVWLDDDLKNPYDYYNNVIKSFYNSLNKMNNTVLYKSKNDLLKNSKKIILMVENASFVAENINYLYNLYNDGVRIVSFSWNKGNKLAGGANQNGILTQKGIYAIKLCEKIGMIFDISHLNMQSALTAVDVSNKPIATHSSCYEVCKHNRNLTDEVLLKLKQKQGIIGVCLYPEFLGKGNVFLQFEKHIKHLLKLSMQKNIAIGSDFDGAKMDENLANYNDFPFLFRYLLKRGMEISLLNDIFFNNAIEFFNNICENR